MIKPMCCSNKRLSKEFADMANFLRLIGEDNRLKILCMLQQGEKCVCEIVENLGLPQNSVSNHLKALKDFGLIKSRQEWRRVYYFADKKSFKKYNSYLINFLKKYEQ